MTTKFTTIVGSAVIGAALLAGAPANAAGLGLTMTDILLLNTEHGYKAPALLAVEDGMVAIETPLGVKQCPEGEVYVTQKKNALGIGGHHDYGCMSKANYQQMLFTHNNRPRYGGGGGYVNTTKSCYGSVGMYGQVFASCY